MRGFLNKIDKVLSVLRDQIDRGEFPRESRLPGVRQLAKTFEVSVSTVGTALETLEEEGLVIRKAGSGVFVQSGPRLTITVPGGSIKPQKRRAGQIAEQICADISSGKYRVGELLPLKKALRFLFNTSSESLNVALAKVETHGLIHRKGAAYVVGPERQARNRQKNRVVLLPGKGASGEMMESGILRPEFRFALGKELSVNGISLLNHHAIDWEPNKASNPKFRDRSLGFVYCIQNMGWVTLIAQGNFDIMEKEMARINRIGLPIVLFSCAPVFAVFPGFNFSKFSNIYPFGIDNRLAGRAAANYLTLMGHKKIAYISYSNEPWNAVRLEGVAGAFSDTASGKGEVVHLHADVNKHHIRTERGRNVQQRTADLEKALSRWYTDINYIQNLHTNEILGRIHDVMTSGHHRPTLRPLFKEALADKDITAWVGADQTVAEYANRYLHAKGLTSGNQISVMAIGDSFPLSDLGITACNVSTDDMGYMAAHCLLGDIPIKKDKLGVVECPPKIIERGTVARFTGANAPNREKADGK